MRINKLFQTAIVLTVCITMTLPPSAFARSQAGQIIDGVKIAQTIADIELQDGHILEGTIVDQSGRPVAGSAVAIGQQSKMIAYLDTDSSGRYRLTHVKPGIYQVASYAGVQSVRVHSDNAPAGALHGIVQVIDQEGIVRGQCSSGENVCCEQDCNQCCPPCRPRRFACLRAIACSPLVWAVVIAAAIVIPIAVSNDDDDAS